MEPGSRLSSANTVDMATLTRSILTYQPPMVEENDVFARIKDILAWCFEWWKERERQEADAKRQRFKIAPEDLKRVVSFIDGDGSGSISVEEFQEVFSMVKR